MPDFITSEIGENDFIKQALTPQESFRESFKDKLLKDVDVGPGVGATEPATSIESFRSRLLERVGEQLGSSPQSTLAGLFDSTPSSGGGTGRHGQREGGSSNTSALRVLPFLPSHAEIQSLPVTVENGRIVDTARTADGQALDDIIGLESSVAASNLFNRSFIDQREALLTAIFSALRGV
jgi:hypothetical protein